MTVEKVLPVHENPAMLRRMAHASLCFAVVGSALRQVVRVRDGRACVADAGAAGDEDFSIAAADEDWAEFAKPLPRPGYHDVIAMVESGHARIDGDLLPFFRNLFVVKAALAAVFGKVWS